LTSWSPRLGNTADLGSAEEKTSLASACNRALIHRSFPTQPISVCWLKQPLFTDVFTTIVVFLCDILVVDNNSTFLPICFVWRNPGFRISRYISFLFSIRGWNKMECYDYLKNSIQQYTIWQILTISFYQSIFKVRSFVPVFGTNFNKYF